MNIVVVQEPYIFNNKNSDLGNVNYTVFASPRRDEISTCVVGRKEFPNFNNGDMKRSMTTFSNNYGQCLNKELRELRSDECSFSDHKKIYFQMGLFRSPTGIENLTISRLQSPYTIETCPRTFSRKRSRVK